MSQMPDKIWLHKYTKYSTSDEVMGYQYEFAEEIEAEGIENFIEYVPKDNFIEKACRWLNLVILDYYVEHPNELIEDFRKAMMEE